MVFRNMIFWRIVALLGLLIGLSSIVIGVYQVQVNRNEHIRIVKEQAYLIARQTDKLIIWDDRVAVRELLEHALKANPILRYAFIERDGKFYVESSADGTPGELLCPVDRQRRHESERQFQDQKGRIFYDIAFDVPGGRAAVHVGLDRAGVDRLVLPSLLWLAAVGIGFFLLMLPVARRVSRDITNEVDSMTLLLRKTNETLETRVVERTSEIARLNENLRIFQESVENSSDAVGMSTPGGKHYYQNRVFEEMFGVIGDNPSETIYVDHAVGREVFRTIMAGGQWAGEVKMYARDRRILDILLRAYAIKDKSGCITALVGIHMDITERKKAEQELRESEERFKSIVNEAPLGIAIVDSLTARFYMVNPALARITGRSMEELERIDWVSITHPDDIQTDKENMAAMNAGKIPGFRMEKRYLHPEGHYFWVNITVAPMYVEDKSKPRHLLMVEDISERKRAEEALRATEKRLAMILNGINASIYIADMQTYEVLFVNETMKSVWGDVTGQLCWKSIQQGQDKPCDFCTNSRLVKENGEPAPAYQWECQNTRNCRWYDCRDVAIRWTDGRLVRMELAIDITERKKLEERLRQAEKMDAVGRLAGGVAHDFNNMLQGILGYSSMLIDALPPDSPLRKDAEEIQTCAERSSELTRQLLAFARKQVIAPVVFDINLRIDGMLKMLRRLISEDVELIWRPASSPATIKIDPGQIDQVLVNLCVNARDAIGGLGKIEIETEFAVIDETFCDTHAGYFPGDYVVMSFSDNGRGMERETLDHLFEPFFTTKAQGLGTGLGLATVHGIVTQNHGFISVDSKPGKGTTFKIYLPRHMEKAAGEEIQKKTVQKPLRGHETILLVEDEQIIVHICKQTLEKLGYQVLPALSPDEAVSIAEKYGKSIDLVLTDVVMPGMNGLELTNRLLVINPRMKRLFMSGFTADVIAHHGMLDPDMHLLQKPFLSRELAEKVRQVLAD